MTFLQIGSLASRTARLGSGIGFDFVARALAYDLCPAAARWERWAKRPIVLLSVLLAMAVALAVFTNPVSASASFALVGVIVVGYGWPALVIRGLTADLRFAGSRGVEGEVTLVIVSIRNRWPFPVWGISIEADIGGRENVALAFLPPRSTTEFRWERVPRCRGEFPRGIVEIVTGFPFGLTFARRAVDVDRGIVIWPATVPLDSFFDAGEITAVEEAVCDDRPGDAGDVIGTRPFRQGDPLRRVHWALTARTGAMIACERQISRATAVRVVVDANPASHDDGGPTGTLENSLRVAASICRAYHHRQARVECRLGRECLSVASGPQGLARFLDALARYQLADVERHAAEREILVGRRGARAAADGLHIAITTPRGLPAMPGRQADIDGIVIVIGSDETSADPPPRAASPTRVIRLGCSEGTCGEFARQWRGLRHAC